ncbi:MAG: PHP domain-containing protein [Solirubrobacteraceae bacterium]
MATRAAPTFDLQSHSVHSDGSLAPADVVSAAAVAGVTLFALSDHDSTAGVAEATAAAERTGIRLIAATEISASFDGRQDLHILGYEIDADDPTLVTALARSRHDREHRAQAMIEALAKLGFAIDHEMLARRTAEGQSIGRPHLAQAVVNRPENRQRLEEAGLLEPTAFLVEYLIEGRPAFVPRAAPSVGEAIELIHEAGGVAVWAHPFWDIADPDGVLHALDEFRGLGLDGVEAFYVTHTESQTRLLAERSATLGLLTTGSSDFHGPKHHTFSAFRAFDTYGLQPVLGPLAA